MTLISPANGAALLILRQANASSISVEGLAAKSATDNITAIANSISGQTSAVTIQASSAINRALLDRQDASDAIVSRALNFLDSDGFKTSDPSVTDVVKKIIGENEAGFAALVKAEKAKGSGMTEANAMANAIRSLIRDNRSQFGGDEFVIGFKLSSGGAIIDNIEDIDGNSTSKTLMADLHAAQAATTEAAKILFESGEQDAEILKTASAVFTGDDFTQALNATSQWLAKWQDRFDLR